jgi:hypothetical protein
MVDDMIMCNTMQEEVAYPTKEVAVDSGCSSAGECPSRTAVMWYGRIGVLEESDHYDPMVQAEPGNTVVSDNVGNSPPLAASINQPHHSKNTNIGSMHSISLTFVEENGVRYT